MSCRSTGGTKVFLDKIEEQSGVKVSQEVWHALRVGVSEESNGNSFYDVKSFPMSRSRVEPEVVKELAGQVFDAFNSGDDDDYESERAAFVDSLANERLTESAAATLSHMVEDGPKSARRAVDRAKDAMAKQKASEWVKADLLAAADASESELDRDLFTFAANNDLYGFSLSKHGKELSMQECKDIVMNVAAGSEDVRKFGLYSRRGNEFAASESERLVSGMASGEIKPLDLHDEVTRSLEGVASRFKEAEWALGFESKFRSEVFDAVREAHGVDWEK